MSKKKNKPNTDNPGNFTDTQAATKQDSKNKYNKNRRYKKNGGKTERETSSSNGARGYGGNDLSWYSHNPGLLDSVNKIAFSYQPGREIPLNFAIDDEEWNTLGDPKADFYYPGIMALTFMPSVGYSDTIDSPINVAAREIYGTIRKMYSSSLEADAPDLLMYILALDSLYMYYEDMKRAYYTINLYTPYNTMYPKSAVQAMGYDFEDLMANKMKLRQNIETAAAMLRTFRVPGYMDLFKRHAFMCANIYADSPSVKSQNYIFRLGGFYQLAHTNTTTSLEIVETSQFRTVEQAMDDFTNAIRILMSWDTAYTINGYFERAFDTSGFLSPSPLVVDGILNPVYNAEVLTQIENATVIHVKNGSLDITQDVVNENMIISKPEWISLNEMNNSVQSCAPIDMLLNLESGSQPDGAAIVIATRLAAVARDEDYLDCGTEILTKLEFFVSNTGFPMAGFETTHMSFNRSFAEANDDDTIPIVDMLFYLQFFSCFNRHPRFVLSGYSSYLPTSEMSKRAWYFGGIDNVTNINSEELQNLHRICLYSEFNCFSN